jgi:lycopene cyclase domain-containing protein
MHGEYLLLLAASLGSVVWLDRWAKLGVFRQWRRLVVALVPLEAVILAWDFLGVERWGWASSRALLIGPYAFGGRIPLEELLFPAVVGACALTVWELVKKWEVGR